MALLRLLTNSHLCVANYKLDTVHKQDQRLSGTGHRVSPFLVDHETGSVNNVKDGTFAVSYQFAPHRNAGLIIAVAIRDVTFFLNDSGLAYGRRSG